MAIGQPAQKPLQVKALIESIDKALYANYIYPDQAKLMGDYLESQLKKGAYQKITDPRELAEKIGADIQTAHHDGHLRVNYIPEGAPNAAAARQADPPNRAEAVQRARDDNFSFKKVEILDGNIGYLQLNGFTGFVEEAKPTVTAALRFLANTSAIIIDLRSNGGGNPGMVLQIASYFFPERTRLNDIYNRRENKTTEAWADPATAENMKLSMPVYILTARRTFSGAEDFSYGMQASKRAVIVGETTGGGAHPTGPVDVGQGFVVSIPYARSINLITKTDWEGTGVVPEIKVPAEQALAKARTVILESRLAQAKTEKEKSLIKWQMVALQAQDYIKPENASAASSFAGAYGKFNVSAQENQLFLNDTNGRKLLLRPVSGNVFIAEDWLQVEFSAVDGKTAMKFVSKPGAEDRYQRFVGSQDTYHKV